MCTSHYQQLAVRSHVHVRHLALDELKSYSLVPAPKPYPSTSTNHCHALAGAPAGLLPPLSTSRHGSWPKVRTCREVHGAEPPKTITIVSLLLQCYLTRSDIIKQENTLRLCITVAARKPSVSRRPLLPHQHHHDFKGCCGILGITTHIFWKVPYRWCRPCRVDLGSLAISWLAVFEKCRSLRHCLNYTYFTTPHY